jgi:DNA invertase Pin-like site-specific DNA recombinase
LAYNPAVDQREIRCDTLERLVVRVEGREALRAVLEFLHAGDVLMVTRIDRLARSIGDLQEIVRTGLAARS